VSWLLDTCAVSEPTKKSPNPKVIAWLKSQDEAELYLSVLTLGEIQRGVEKLPENEKRQALERWLKRDIHERFAGRILPVDSSVALTWGKILAHSSRPLPAVDSLIAATGIAHSLTIVSRNTQDLIDTGALVFDPWTL
jgi:predicted nucleic acid-binding protein